MTEMLSASALAQAIRAGRLTPTDVATLCADAIRAKEDEIRAFAAVDLDALVANAGAPGLKDTPLAGLPVGVKDVLDTRDFATERGSPLYAGYRPPTDAAVVRMAARAGGLIAGKTATTEFAFMQPAPTRNPRRISHTPGGSSAGSAAAVAAGMLPITLGTQTGGSIIRPASFCGVTGYKPSFKLVPVLGLKVFSWSLDTIGFFGAHVADVAFAAGAITGRDLAIDVPPEAPAIAMVKTIRASEATEDSHNALETAIRAAERRGARITVLDLPAEVEAANDAHAIIQGYEVTLAFADEWDHSRDQLSHTLRDYLGEAKDITPEQYDAARRTARRARNALADALSGFDGVLTFSAVGEAPAGLGSTGTHVFNRLWTLVGTPCVSVAGLHGASGMPVGVQVIGRFARDKATLNLARFVERAVTDA